MTQAQYLRLAVAVIAIAAMSSVLSAALGDSFMSIPGIAGSWQGDSHKSWIRITARYWMNVPPRAVVNLGIGDPHVSGPPAPLPGSANQFAIALDKKNPDLPQLMKFCTARTTVPELTFAEPAARGPNFPPYWEYKLTGVQFGKCDVVADADDQAFVVSFENIEWLNYDSRGPLTVPLTSTAADIPNVMPAPESSKTRTFLITWFGWATLGDDDTCAGMTNKPPEAEFYALLPKEQAAAIRSKRGERPISYGGPDRGGPYMEERGPNMLNVCQMPGIVRDPGHAEPHTKQALGVNLDRDDGSGAAPAGTCKHTNFVSPDGMLQGVDNQLYRVFGCIPGFRGKKGYMNQTHNARRADGNVVTLIQISGIDDLKNDDHVEIGVFYARDKPMRSQEGAFIPHYSFRMTDDPIFARFNRRWSARIVDGYVITPPIKTWNFHNGQGGPVSLADAQFRLHIEPNGDLSGVVGGYIDWRELASSGAVASSYQEGLFNFSCPAVYQSFKRNADAMKDPITGECNGISMGWEIEGIPAFITTMAPKETKSTSASHVAEKRR
jgi:hypothetical protein